MKTKIWIGGKRPDTQNFRTTKEAEETRTSLHQNIVRIDFPFEVVYTLMLGSVVTELSGNKVELFSAYINDFEAEYIGVKDLYYNIPEHSGNAPLLKQWRHILWSHVAKKR